MVKTFSAEKCAKAAAKKPKTFANWVKAGKCGAPTAPPQMDPEADTNAGAAEMDDAPPIAAETGANAPAPPAAAVPDAPTVEPSPAAGMPGSINGAPPKGSTFAEHMGIVGGAQLWTGSAGDMYTNGILPGEEPVDVGNIWVPNESAGINTTTIVVVVVIVAIVAFLAIKG